MIHKLVKFKAKKENTEKVEKMIKEFLDKVLENEPNTLYYESLQEEDLVSFINIITFSDEEARIYHESTPYGKKFVDDLYPLLEAEPVISNYNIVKSIKRY
ncbi:MAG: putative quinol monooxygenase [Promethearchaeota archaeon]